MLGNLAQPQVRENGASGTEPLLPNFVRRVWLRAWEEASPGC